MDADALSARFMDLNRLGIPRQPRSLMPITDEQVYRFDPDRYSFYMHLLQALSDPNSSLLKDVFGVVNRTRRTRERIDEATQHVVNDLLYLTKNPMDGAQVAQQASLSNVGQVGGGLLNKALSYAGLSDSEGIGSAISQGLNTLGNGNIVSSARDALGNGSDLVNSAKGALGNGSQLGDLVSNATGALGNGSDLVSSARDALGNGSDIMDSATDALGSDEDHSHMLQGSLTKIGSITPDLANLAAQHGIDVSGMQLPQQLASQTPDAQPPQPNEDSAVASPEQISTDEEASDLKSPIDQEDLAEAGPEPVHTGEEAASLEKVSMEADAGPEQGPMEAKASPERAFMKTNASPEQASTVESPINQEAATNASLPSESIVQHVLQTKPDVEAKVTIELEKVVDSQSTDDIIQNLQAAVETLNTMHGGGPLPPHSFDSGMLKEVLTMLAKLVEDADNYYESEEDKTKVNNAVKLYVKYLIDHNTCIKLINSLFNGNLSIKDKAVYFLTIYKYITLNLKELGLDIDFSQLAALETFALGTLGTFNNIEQDNINEVSNAITNYINLPEYVIDSETHYEKCILPIVQAFLKNASSSQYVYCAKVILTKLKDVLYPNPNIEANPNQQTLEYWINTLSTPTSELAKTPVDLIKSTDTPESTDTLVNPIKSTDTPESTDTLVNPIKSTDTPEPTDTSKLAKTPVNPLNSNPASTSQPSTPNETSLPNRASAFLANLFQKSDSEEEPPCNDEPVDVGISVDPAELTAAVQQIDPNLVVVDGASPTQEPQKGGAFAAREDLLRMLGGAWEAHGTQSGGGFYDRILGQLNLAETQPPEMRRRLENYILNQYENDPVYSPAAAAVTTTDRLIFITLTFVLRAVALFLLEWGLQANYITSFNNAFFLYIGVYLSLFALMALLVNASDKVLSLHMLFYYLSLHSGDGRGLIRMFLHVFIIMLLLPVPLLLRRRNANGTTMDEYERNRQISTTMGQFTLFVWIATSALALRF